MDTTAVIMAAGRGRRLAPLTQRRPKPMLPVVDRPVLEYVVEAVADAGIDDIVLVVGYGQDRIRTYFGDGDDWGVSIRYATQETQLGTAHAVAQAEDRVAGSFLVLNGDRIIDPAVVEDVAAGLADATVTMAVTRLEAPGDYGMVTLTGDRVTGIIEKPTAETPSEIINAGVYGFPPEVFDVIRDLDQSTDGEYQLPDVIAEFIGERTVRAVRYDGRWLDVSHLWDLLSVTTTVLDREGGETAGTVAEGARVSDTAHVARTASVGTNAVVGRGSVVGANARIGPNATVERSVILSDATVDAGAVLRDCVVGANATVGPNTTVAGGDATVVMDGAVYESVPLGAAIGDNAHVGGASAFDPGAIVGDGATIEAGTRVRGTIEADAEVRRG